MACTIRTHTEHVTVCGCRVIRHMDCCHPVLASWSLMQLRMDRTTVVEPLTLKRVLNLVKITHTTDGGGRGRLPISIIALKLNHA